MTDFQIAVQIAATSVMAITSVLLAWNARRMRLINEMNVKVGIWGNRFAVYSGIMDWHDNMSELLAQVEDSTYVEFELLNKLDFHKLEKYIRKAKLLFSGNKELSSFLGQYEDRASAIYLKIYFKTEKPKIIGKEALVFSEWFLENEDELFKMLDDYLVVA